MTEQTDLVNLFMSHYNAYSKKRIFIIILIALVGLPLFGKSADMGKIIAYPNPFSVKNHNLTIRPEKSMLFEGRVEFTIYNYNEKEIYSGHVNDAPVVWSGYTKSGQRVAPGLYFIKLIQTFNDGSTGFSIIKVIVQ